jgi:TRAP transporter 4TM/12TM fusion protein
LAGKRKGFFAVLDGLFFATAVVALGYLILNYNSLIEREGAPNQADIVMGVLAIVIVLEATRRVIGWPLVIIAGAFLVYALAGPYFPGILSHRGYDIDRIATHMYLTTSGIFGQPIYVSANIITLFIIFGAFLEKSGAARVFMDVANGAVGWFRGGPAKAAVVGSALMGTVSGSAAANAATIGTFTIPLMKKTGYQSHVASAIEAVSSTGGQLMPPVMGTAAFVMAEMIGVSYVKVCLAALIPAILYYFTLFVMVDLEAVKAGLKGIKREDLPRVGKSLAEGIHLFLPLLLLIILMVMQYSPIYASSRAVVALILVAMIKKATRFNWKSFINAMESGAKGVISVAVACACAGLVSGVITLTGLGLKMSGLLVALSGQNILALLVLVMLTCLVLGMGLPTVACYILLGALVGPAMVNMGLPIMAAHMFILYFGCISAITPPVALAAYTAAGIGGANPNTTGFMAFKMGIVAFIVPYMFVYGPELLASGTVTNIIIAVIAACVGCFALAAGIHGYLLTRTAWWQRVVLIASALSLIKPGLVTDALGLALLALVLVVQKAGKKSTGVSA